MRTEIGTPHSQNQIKLNTAKQTMAGDVAKQQEREDRISKLPDELLCQVLSEFDFCTNICILKTMG